MNVQILLSSGTHPVFLKSISKGDIVTTFDPKHALTLPSSTARMLLPMVKRRWPMAQLSYSLDV
ncbi:TPA: hypothetical protein RQK43_000234 [Vibrio vulnificus]|uniref:Uncharacterized protein n=1 Tax=Vibrio vulnificus TaxID=672 RepID=A0AAN1PSB7_VIBVL|nr:hypothetical protein [Vibrio vulnificus]AXX62071.1 hypothetical protein FORC53_3732 [Vibrio vulnificus]EHY1011554.1 hypothetical protein [Vibrio vulnificus]EHY1119781.1 hypothetical protein [Vibrio vulnificus]EJT0554684.1 hypothetical protein [Vibrio vulnificus]ELE1959468.1 hypothetical protein [Vibrio vulnificus]